MKAIVCPKYGAPEVLQIRDIKKPVPKSNEMLIKIHATTVNGADARIRGAVFPAVFKLPVRLLLGFKGPKRPILGVELAGEIESVGSEVKRFKPGDAVMVSTGAHFGAHAEYICLPEKTVMAVKPANISWEEAAGVPHCALAALHFLHKAKVSKGKKVIIYGAAGGIGTFAVQLAKNSGAEVTGVCSTSGLNMVKSIGADHVIDYTTENFDAHTGRYDVIFDTVGKSNISQCAKLLTKKGMYLSAVHLDLSRILTGMRISMTSGKKVIGGVANYTSENLDYLRKLAEAGKIRTVIDKKYTLDQIVEAHAYVDTGHKKGHVVVSISH